jgi:hypothetical protein
MTGKDIHDRLRDISAGQFDLPESRLPGADQNPDIRFGRSLRRDGASAVESSNPSKQTLWDGLAALTGLAGVVGGFLLGASFYDGNNTLMTLLVMAGTTVLGFLAGVVPVMLLENGWKAIGERILFARRGTDATAQNLAQYWSDKFGVVPERALIEAVDENGRAWVMDKSGNFILRMRGGKTLFVGHEGGGVGAEQAVVEKRRGGRRFDAEDARLYVLVYRSLGRSEISLTGGSKKAMRLLWVAAKQGGLEVPGYQPDKRALQMMNKLRRGV